jgi:hypothetical protein
MANYILLKTPQEIKNAYNMYVVPGCEPTNLAYNVIYTRAIIYMKPDGLLDEFYLYYPPVGNIPMILQGTTETSEKMADALYLFVNEQLWNLVGA